MVFSGFCYALWSYMKKENWSSAVVVIPAQAGIQRDINCMYLDGYQYNIKRTGFQPALE